MRIGIFDPYLDTFGGGEKYMLTLAVCMARYHSVSIFWNPQEKVAIKNRAHEKLGIDISSLDITKNIFSKNVSLASRVQKSRSFDYIVFLSDGSIPFLLSNVILHFQSPVEWIKPTIKTKVKFARVRATVCNSSYTKQYIDRKFNTNSKVVYPPVDVGNVREEKKENIILNVGRYGINWQGSSYKKQDILVESFKRMVDLGVKNWRLVLIVSLASENLESIGFLKNKAHGYPISIIENPSNEELWSYYNKAKIYWHAAGYGEDLFLHPDRAEHFGIATVEAMGAGAVPVVINAGGQKEIVEDGRDGFLWNSITELLEKTKKVMRERTLWESMSMYAKQKARIFNTDRFCEEVNDLLI